MKIFVIGDPHIDESNLSYIKPILDEIVKKINDTKPDLCVSLGDTLHRKARVYTPSQYMAINFYHEIAKICKLIVLIGNHDMVKETDFFNPIHSLYGISDPNIRIIYKSEYEQFPTGELFAYVPYVPKGRFNEALSLAKLPRSPTLIFAHQEFRGCSMDTGNISDNGDHWPDTSSIIITGHIHKHQIIKNVIYVGTFMQHSYGEDQDKAVMLIDISPTKLTYQRFELTTVPKRLTMNCTLQTIEECISKLPLNNTRKNTQEAINGKTLVRVIVTLDAVELKTLNSNSVYSTLHKIVDQIDLNIVGTKTGIASTMMKQHADIEKITLENLVNSLLKGDEESLKIFNTEICS